MSAPTPLRQDLPMGPRVLINGIWYKGAALTATRRGEAPLSGRSGRASTCGLSGGPREPASAELPTFFTVARG
jgi:hypothetical protein